MAAVPPNPLAPQWKEALNLSLRHPPEFFENPSAIGDVPHAGALRTTFNALNASGVFCVQHVPTVVIISVDEYDPVRTANLHAALWNQGLASLLVVISRDTARLFSLARIPADDDELLSRCLVDTLKLATDALALGNLLYSAESGRFWEENRQYFKPKERVDRVLLDNLAESHRLLHKANLPREAAQTLLIQTMFVAYLEDREILSEEYFRTATNERASDFGTTLKDVKALEGLFDVLQEDFNRDLFVAPCSFDADDRGPNLQTPHLNILARFRAGREEMRGPGGQYRIWPYNFKYMPVELISAVHDRFLGERGAGARRASGAYYTPMLLADVVVGQVWDRLSPAVRDSACFLDPACGSGIFLVRLFQRLCEHRRDTESKRKISWYDLNEILSRLGGWDLDGGAVRVAVFSLYVALLEEVTPPDIRVLMERGRVLPELYGRTLRHGDFFSVPVEDEQVDVIIGNPPWSSRQGAGHSSLAWCRQKGLPAPSRQQAWPFVWKSLRHLRDGGIVAFLLPAMGFLHNHTRQSVEARKRLIREARVFTVVNFADMRFQLFDGAVHAAALFLFGPPTAGSPAYRFDYLTPKADPNLRTRRLITIRSADQCRLDSRIVEADPSVFKKRLWMSEPESRLFNYLGQFPNLRNLVVQFGDLQRRRQPPMNRWVIGQGFQPAHLNPDANPNYEPRESNIIATTPYLPIESFRVLAQSAGGLRPWKSGLVRRGGFEAGFDGLRVMVPRGVAAGKGGLRLRATYAECPLTFQDIIQVILVPPEEKGRAMLLTALLNSKLMVWFAFHGTSSLGADRPEVQQAELLRLPFPDSEDMPDSGRSRRAASALVRMVNERLSSRVTHGEIGSSVFDTIDRLTYDFFCLSEEEVILIDDTVEQVLPTVQPGRRAYPELWRPSDSIDRRAYARTLVDNLVNWFDGDCYIETRLLAQNADLAVLRLSLKDAPVACYYDEISSGRLSQVLSHLAKHIHQPLPGNLQSAPDFRVFIGRELFLVKPLAKRDWLRSAALADANAIALDLHMAAGANHDAGSA